MKKIKIGAFGAFRGLVLMQSLTVIPEAQLVEPAEHGYPGASGQRR